MHDFGAADRAVESGVDKENRDRYSFSFVAATLFGSETAEASQYLKPDAE